MIVEICFFLSLYMASYFDDILCMMCMSSLCIVDTVICSLIHSLHFNRGLKCVVFKLIVGFQ